MGKTGVILMRDRCLLGFTFAETLMAVVIIGIIAAMTIPTLINKYHNETLQISIKKQYRELEHNLTALQADTFYKSTLQRSILNKKYAIMITDNLSPPAIRKAKKVWLFIHSALMLVQQRLKLLL